MRIRSTIYACLFLPCLAGWMNASLSQQFFLILCLGITLEVWLIRPLQHLNQRAQALNPNSISHTSLADLSLEQTLTKLESHFDQRIQEAEREKQQIRNLLSALPDPVLHYNQEDQLLFLNPAAELALELHHHDLIGRSLAASWTNLLRPPEIKTDLQPVILSFAKPGKILIEKALEARKNGQEVFEIGSNRTYRSQIIVMSSGEKVLTLRDITDIKRLEEVRQLFLSSISHELRTPLTIIKGFAITLLDHPDIPVDFCKPLQKIDREADRLTRLVNDLLDLSQIRSRRLSVEMSPFDSHELLEETLSLMAPLAERRVVNLKLTTEAPILKELYADRDRIKQVLINLLDNAIKFTPGGGQVQIVTATSESNWEITVSDSGPGVSPSDLPNLFEHFFRGNHSRKFIGSGLGLAIVKEIVTLHQGTVTASCLPTCGLKIHVCLPRRSVPNRQ